MPDFLFSITRMAAVVLCLTMAWPVGAAEVTLTATDAGFVTETGGSAKGDGTVTPGAKYNYSAGFELHYGSGALGAPLVPLFRKNYFVFDLSMVSGPLVAAKLTLWSGTLESADSSEAYGLKEIIDMPAALALTTALAGGSMVSEFDDPSDPLVMSGATLYGKLGEGPLILGGLSITHAMNDSFIDIVFTPAGLAYLSGFVGGKVVLAGLVPTALPPAFPQQPFGLTGPDIPSAVPKTPMLTITAVPEPAAAWLMGAGLALGLMVSRRRLASRLSR